jgi:hypothetical protein
MDPEVGIAGVIGGEAVSSSMTEQPMTKRTRRKIHTPLKGEERLGGALQPIQVRNKPLDRVGPSHGGPVRRLCERKNEHAAIDNLFDSVGLSTMTQIRVTNAFPTPLSRCHSRRGSEIRSLRRELGSG